MTAYKTATGAMSELTPSEAMKKVEAMRAAGLNADRIHKDLQDSGYLCNKTGKPASIYTVQYMIKKVSGNSPAREVKNGLAKTKSTKIELSPTSDQKFVDGLKELLSMTSMDIDMRTHLLKTAIQKRELDQQVVAAPTVEKAATISA